MKPKYEVHNFDVILVESRSLPSINVGQTYYVAAVNRQQGTITLNEASPEVWDAHIKHLDRVSNEEYKMSLERLLKSKKDET